jgi:RNA polymerase sigma-70 factor (ECF subfamily)
VSRHGPDDRDDIELVDAARNGDRAAMEALLARHYDRVATLCRRLMSNRADAEDATQNALLAIVAGLAKFDGRSALTTWIHRVATNACLDELRRRARRPVPTDDAPDGAVTTSPRADHHDPDTATRVDIDAALTRLPLEFRAPVVLRDLCALDYAEIAELLGIPPGTVRSRIARGRRMLMEILGNPDRSGVVQGDSSP